MAESVPPDPSVLRESYRERRLRQAALRNSSEEECAVDVGSPDLPNSPVSPQATERTIEQGGYCLSPAGGVLDPIEEERPISVASSRSELVSCSPGRMLTEEVDELGEEYSDKRVRFCQQTLSNPMPIKLFSASAESSDEASCRMPGGAEEQLWSMESPVPHMKARSCDSHSTSPSKKSPVDMADMHQSLTDLRRKLAGSEPDEHKIFRKSISMECLGAAPTSVTQEVARLARRIDCMERAFLMSTTEPIQGRLQDVGTCPQDDSFKSTGICEDFVHVLEQAREARNREVADLQHRMFMVESHCSAEASRQKELVELCEVFARKPLVSSTGGTTHHPHGDPSLVMHIPREWSTDECVQAVNSEVDASVRAAVAHSKAVLSRHVAALQRQLSEDLMEQLRVKADAVTDVCERRIQAVSELFAKEIGEMNPYNIPAELDFYPSGRPRRETSDDGDASDPMHDSPLSQGLMHARDAEHANSFDVADEGTITPRPHCRSIDKASRDALLKRRLREPHLPRLDLCLGFTET